MEALMPLLTNPRFYLTILPGLGFGIFIVVLSIRGMRDIKRWEYAKAYEHVHSTGRLRPWIFALVLVDLFLASFIIGLSFEPRTNFLIYAFVVLGGNALPLYFIMLELLAKRLARKRLRELSAEGAERMGGFLRRIEGRARKR
jgi:hypothetical protein